MYRLDNPEGFKFNSTQLELAGMPIDAWYSQEAQENRLRFGPVQFSLPAIEAQEAMKAVMIGMGMDVDNVATIDLFPEVFFTAMVTFGKRSTSTSFNKHWSEYKEKYGIVSTLEVP